MNIEAFPHDSANPLVVGPDRMCNTAWACSDAARPIVPMRPDRPDPGAACLPLRATARGCIILSCMFYMPYMLYMST